VPIAGILGDQQAALFGQLCTRPGLAKCTYGTGCFLLMFTGSRPVASRNRLLTTVAWRIGEEPIAYALEGSVFSGGAAIQWLRDGLQIIPAAPDVNALAASVNDSGGVVVVPAFTGLGAPEWDATARGTILGLTRGSTSAHLARATLEGIALQVADLLNAMEADTGTRLRELRVDGGAAASDLLMQLQADLSGVRVTRPENLETTAQGAAFMAGLAVGVWPDLAALAKFALASVYRKTNRDKDAIELYKQLMDKPTTSVGKATAQMELADLYQQKQQPQEAKRIYEQVQKENPNTEIAQLAQQKLGGLK